eukprot:NODE_6_length_70510_cov_1.054395.p33 type:complete len:284 gc:universal NODE_6_length_70510_cov_1.054395:5547-4696(-)
MGTLVSLIPGSQMAEDYVLAFNEKDQLHIYEVFESRQRLYRTLYTHPVSRAIELMVIDILELSDKVYNFKKLIQTDYLRLTDDILREIGRSKAPELLEARNIVKRIDERKLYKKVMQKVLREDVYLSLIKEHKRNPQFILDYVEHVNFPKDNIIIDLFTINCGKGKENPLKFINYITRDEELIPIENFNMANITGIYPITFESYFLRIYCKNEIYLDDIRECVHLYWESELKHKCSGQSMVDYTPRKGIDIRESASEASPLASGFKKKRKLDGGDTFYLGIDE